MEQILPAAGEGEGDEDMLSSYRASRALSLNKTTAKDR
jgi:hypothetical protein